MDIHTQQEWNPHSVAQIVVEIMQACKKGTCSVTTATPLEVQALKEVHIVEWQPPKVYNLTNSIQISRKLSFITTTVN